MSKKSPGWFPGFWSKQLDLPVTWHPEKCRTSRKTRNSVLDRRNPKCLVHILLGGTAVQTRPLPLKERTSLSHGLRSWPRDLLRPTECKQMWRTPRLEASKISTSPLVPALRHKRIVQVEVVPAALGLRLRRPAKIHLKTRGQSEPNP